MLYPTSFRHPRAPFPLPSCGYTGIIQSPRSTFHPRQRRRRCGDLCVSDISFMPKPYGYHTNQQGKKNNSVSVQLLKRFLERCILRCAQTRQRNAQLGKNKKIVHKSVSVKMFLLAVMRDEEALLCWCACVCYNSAPCCFHNFRRGLTYFGEDNVGPTTRAFIKQICKKN